MRPGEVSPMYKWPHYRVKHLRRDARFYLANVLPAKDVRRFCILTTFRTGSEVLVELLNSHPQIRCEGEIMNGRPMFPYLFARGKARAANYRGLDAYGFKLLSIQLMDFFNPPDRDFARRLASDGFFFVHLRRRNVLRQAISYFRAAATGDWHPHDLAGAGPPASQMDGPAEPNEDVRTRGRLELDVSQLIFEMRLIDIQNGALEWMIEGLPQRSLWYEDHLERPELHQSTIDELCRDLSVDPAPVRASLKKIAPKRLDDEIANIDEVREQLRATKYAPFLSDAEADA